MKEEKDYYKPGRCFICRNNTPDLKAYAHLECCYAIEQARKKRLEFLISKYGDGTIKFMKVISEEPPYE